MGITHKLYDFKFDVSAWQNVISRWRAVVDDAVIASLIGSSESIIRQWATGDFKDEFPYPSMTLFLRTCNALDLDPRDFFDLCD